MQVHLLLEVAANRGANRLPDDGEYRLMVEFCVVEAVQEVNGTWARRGETDADLAGEFGMGGGHERGLLLMAYLHELEAVERAIESAQDAVDAVARIAIDALHAPFREAREHVIGDRGGHGDLG